MTNGFRLNVFIPCPNPKSSSNVFLNLNRKNIDLLEPMKTCNNYSKQNLQNLTINPIKFKYERELT